MSRHRVNHHLLRLAAAAAALVFTAIVATCIWRGTRQPAPVSADVAKLASLPPDLESMIEGYVFRESGDGLSTEIKGRQIVRRGKKLLGLRSNVIKTSYFDDISGTFRSNRGVFSFSAAGAEWDMVPASPMVLRGDIRMRVDGREIPGVRRCRIYLKKGVIAVMTDHSAVYQFK